LVSRRPAGFVALLLAVALAGLLAACGSGEKSPPDTVRAPTTPSNAVSPEEQEGGAGDEEPIRVPARFTFTRSGDVRPTVIAVPAFLAIELTGLSKDGEPHEIVFRGTTIAVPAGGRASARLEGLKDGRHPVAIDGRENAATIVSGAEPGP
jgi:hypothetical protein